MPDTVHEPPIGGEGVPMQAKLGLEELLITCCLLAATPKFQVSYLDPLGCLRALPWCLTALPPTSVGLSFRNLSTSLVALVAVAAMAPSIDLVSVVPQTALALEGFLLVLYRIAPARRDFPPQTPCHLSGRRPLA